jgi:hypothetical protein
MRNAETVVGVRRARGRRSLPWEARYRQRSNPARALRASGRLDRHDGALTPGVTADTVEALARDTSAKIIAA